MMGEKKELFNTVRHYKTSALNKEVGLCCFLKKVVLLFFF